MVTDIVPHPNRESNGIRFEVLPDLLSERTIRFLVVQCEVYCEVVRSRYHSPVFIGDRRTTQSIRAFRSPRNVVVIPKDKTLRDVRTGVEMGGYRFPAALRIMARTNPNLHIFEYRGETLYTHEANGLLDAITEVEADPLLEP